MWLKVVKLLWTATHPAHPLGNTYPCEIMARSDESCYDLIGAFQAKVKDDIPDSLTRLMQTRLNSSRASISFHFIRQRH